MLISRHPESGAPRPLRASPGEENRTPRSRSPSTRPARRNGSRRDAYRQERQAHEGRHADDAPECVVGRAEDSGERLAAVQSQDEEHGDDEDLLRGEIETSLSRWIRTCWPWRRVSLALPAWR